MGVSAQKVTNMSLHFVNLRNADLGTRHVNSKKLCGGRLCLNSAALIFHVVL